MVKNVWDHFRSNKTLKETNKLVWIRFRTEFFDTDTSILIGVGNRSNTDADIFIDGKISPITIPIFF